LRSPFEKSPRRFDQSSQKNIITIAVVVFRHQRVKVRPEPMNLSEEEKREADAEAEAAVQAVLASRAVQTKKVSARVGRVTLTRQASSISFSTIGHTGSN
jgi:hypothetical protein